MLFSGVCVCVCSMSLSLCLGMDNFGGNVDGGGGGGNNMDRFGPSGMGRMNGKDTLTISLQMWSGFMFWVFSGLFSWFNLLSCQRWTAGLPLLSTGSLVEMKWACHATVLETLLREEWVSMFFQISRVG